MKNNKDHSISSYYKVPFREVYCATIPLWIVAVLRCHIWLRIFRPNLPSIGAIATACIAIVLLSTGCKTTQTVTNWPDGTSTTNSVSTIDPQRTANAIQAILPTAVRIAVAKEPKSREYLAKTQIAVCLLASSGNLTPEQLKQAVALTGINEIQTPEVQVAIEATYGIYQAYFSDVVANKLNQSEWLVPVLSAICNGIGNGLATSPVAEVPATPAQ